MPLAEFIEWQLLEIIDPYGEAGHEFRHARLMHLIANIHRDRESHRQPFPLTDFLYEPEPYLTDEERLLQQQLADLAVIGG